MIPKRGEWIYKRPNTYCPTCGRRIATYGGGSAGGSWICHDCLLKCTAMPAQIYDFPACVAEPLVKAKDGGMEHLLAALDICQRTLEYVELLKELNQWTPEDDVRIWNCAAAAILDQQRCIEYSVGRPAPQREAAEK